MNIRFFFLSWDYVLHQYDAIAYHSRFLAAVFFKKVAIIIAIIGQKTSHWQLRKVASSGMYHCNFEAIGLA